MRCDVGHLTIMKEPMNLNPLNITPLLPTTPIFETKSPQLLTFLKNATFELDGGFYYGTRGISVAKEGFNLEQAIKFRGTKAFDEEILTNEEYQEYFGFAEEEFINAFNAVSEKYKIVVAANDMGDWISIAPLKGSSNEYCDIIHHLVNDLGMINSKQ